MKWSLPELLESRNLRNTKSFCLLGNIILRIVAANLIIILFFLVLVAGAGLAAEAKTATGKVDFNKALLESYNLIEKQQYQQAEALLAQILTKDPGNPLALSDKAAILVSQKKFDQAATCLEQALPRAKGYLVQANQTCAVGQICLAFKPAAGAANQELAPLIKTNIQMIKFMAAASPQEKK